MSQLVAFGAFLGSLAFASAAFASAPDVVVDQQMAPVAGLSGPQSIAVAPSNPFFLATYYVADSGNNRVVAYVDGVASTVSTGGYTLVGPNAVAVDSNGDLFIGDSPTSGVGRVIEALATNGTLNGTVNQVVLGGALKDVTALAVDTNPSSSTFNTLYIGDDISAALYSVAAGTTTLTPLNISGLPTNVIPSALVKDSAGNLFVADLNSTVYEIPGGSTTATIYFVPSFLLYEPSGLALDPQGNLYILTDTAEAPTPSQQVPENIIKVPTLGSGSYDTSSAYRVPLTGVSGSGILNGSGIAFDSLGDLYVADYASNDTFEVILPPSLLYLSAVNVNTTGSTVALNYGLNASNRLRGFSFSGEGDNSSEIQDLGGSCPNTGNTTTGSDGGAISTSDPFICTENFAADPSYPGIRSGAIKLKGASATILASTGAFSLGIAGEAVLYPLHERNGATGLDSPAGLAVSGEDKKLYITDNGSTPAIWSANGPGGSNLTAVSTGTITLSDPLGIAINGAGDLYVADSGLGDIVVVPSNSAVAPYTANPGGLLLHPLSVAFDTSGNLFIGDAGASGSGATTSSPGFVVEVPVGGGSAFKVSTGGVTVVYPQALAADPYTGNLIVGDRGASGGPGQVVDIAAGGGSATVTTPSGVTDPVGIAFDPAEDYYVLDQPTGDLVIVPAVGGYEYSLYTDAALVDTPSALAITSGGASFVAANHASTGVNASNGIVFLDSAAKATLSFGSVAVGSTSGQLNARINNIGTASILFSTPYVTTTGDTADFTVVNTSCVDGLGLSPGSGPCNIYYEFMPVTTGALNETNTYNTSSFAPTASLELKGTGRAR
ncbi:MAG TPA: hypothetical protein VHX11_08435 [Acidobacteriaceae bacterium]|jgi:hypothetical protein|nr:hypothetical protein [Acidobacteriaceae bacterium]